MSNRRSYEEYLSPSQLRDLNTKLIAFWSSVVKHSKSKGYPQRELAKYTKRASE
jgi:hypothetical protein